MPSLFTMVFGVFGHAYARAREDKVDRLDILKSTRPLKTKLKKLESGEGFQSDSIDQNVPFVLGLTLFEYRSSGKLLIHKTEVVN